jgi:translation initiation factor IF-1
MPKNLKGGNKAKKFKNSTDTLSVKETPIPLQSENSHVAKIVGIMGDCRFKCKIVTADGISPTDIIVHLPKSSRKFGRIVSDSIVKISLRDFEVNKGDILYNYNQNDIQFLINNGYMTNMVSNTNNENDELIFSDDVSNDNFNIAEI